MGDSKQKTSSTQQQSGDITPYAPTQGELNKIIGGIGGIDYQPTASQTSALGQIANNASFLPNFTGQATDFANNLAAGGTNYQPIVNTAFSQYQGAVNPFMSGSLDPMQTPGLSDALATIRNDVSNSVNGMFAGAGRDLSGLNQQALARGIAQGEAPVIANQYNANVANRLNAANGLLTGAQSTANNLSGLQQTQFGNQFQGVTNGANIVNQAANASPLASLAASQLSYGLPIQNLAQLEALTVPIAGLGKQYTGTTNATSETTKSDSPLSTALGIFGTLFPQGLSDRRAKEDIRQVGKLNDGQKVYSYRYKGDGETRLGLMADEVKKRIPKAVGLLGDLMTVDYRMATNKAASMAGK